MVRKNQLNKHDSGQEDSAVLMIETEEINYDLDSDPELEADSELIKYEFNMIELPFFTKDKNIEDGRARKYTFSARDNSYMKVTPSGDKDLISNKIPQEFDEKIFYGILKLSKEQNSKTVVTDYFTLAKVSSVPYKNLERIKDSIQRLRNCKIEFNNLFYNAELKGRMDGNQDFNILQDKEEYTFKELLRLSEEKKEKYQKYFRNSKISEILVLTLADKVYKNIEKKGFLYFNQKELLEIDNATARKLFLLVTKWQGWEKKSVIKRSCRFIASRIPLSWEKANIPKTVEYIESASFILKKKNLIKDFVLIRNKPLGNSYIEFYFSNETSKLIDYNMKAAGITTGHEGMIIDSVEDEFLQEDKQMNIFETPALKEIKGLLELIPEEFRNDSNRRTLEQYSEKGSDFIRSNIEYTKKNCTGNFSAYLKKALDNDWAEGEREKTEYLKKQKAEARRKEEEEKEQNEGKNEELRITAEKKYKAMTPEELESIHQEARESMYFKMILQKKITSKEIKEEEALKEAALLMINGKKPIN